MGENMWGHESFPQKMYSYTKPSHHSRGLSGTGTPVQGPQLWAESSRGKRGFPPEVPSPLTGPRSVPSDGRPMQTDDRQGS